MIYYLRYLFDISQRFIDLVMYSFKCKKALIFKFNGIKDILQLSYAKINVFLE